ncbi:isocitrate lyase/phosphoenolpyruvate mutase family protein [Roseateles sp.]|uniref:isocitrate lyase/PEP mutase family protein n=1 Tax=Roseateles sp. TaxID=1971397 RepID=UPI002F3F2647
MTHVSAFRRLHQGPGVLRLPNAWDAVSARLFEQAGASAIATTSAGVAWALGYRDGRSLPVEEALGVAQRIVRVAKGPVSIDIENGYADDPEQVARTVARLVSLGVAGINIEDGPDDPALLAAKIRAIREMLAVAGADLFINARTDVILADLVEPSLQVEETIRRGLQYAAAGADGLFVPGARDEVDIEEIARRVALPLNVMAWPDLAPAATLARLGVRRLSAGSAIPQLAWGAAEFAAKSFLETGESEPLLAGAKQFGQVQQLFPAA